MATESYSRPVRSDGSPQQTHGEKHVNSLVSIDLLEAARRSDSFPKDWTPEKVALARQRYERFLQLAAENPGRPLAPTRDIDEMWHLHMMSPRAYFEDCQRLFGRILDHDGGFGKAEHEIPILKATFEETARLWEAKYGEAYMPGAPERGTVDCWHDCQGRCWHDCKSKSYEPVAVAATGSSQ